MAAQSIDFRTDCLLDALPPLEREELARFIGKAHENGLQLSDYYTIRDLQELSDCRDRALTVLLACLFLSLREGSVCLELSPKALLRRLDGVLDCDRAKRAANEIRAGLDGKSRFGDLIGETVDSGKPVIRHTTGGRELLYFQKYLRHENRLNALLEQRFAASATAAPAAGQIAAFSELVAMRAKQGIPFSNEQKLAIGLSLLRKFAVISGGPGTGKTSAVVAMLQCLVRTGVAPERILLGCPTGRAAQRLTESIRSGAANLGNAAALSMLRAQTLHRLLGYSGATGHFFHCYENPLPADVLIVDEVSMMDIVLTTRLLEAAPASARIILLGDKDQLPSVEAGSVLGDLMPRYGAGAPCYSAQMRSHLLALTGIEPPEPEGAAAARSESVVILTTNFRSQKHIVEVAASINGLAPDDRVNAEALVARLPEFALSEKRERLVWPELQTLRAAGHVTGGGFFRLDHAHKLNVWRGVLEAWARHHYIESGGRERRYPDLVRQTVLPAGDLIPAELEARIAQIFSIVNSARVLTLLREGNWGCQGVNAYLAQLMQPTVVRSTSHPAARIFAGAPVLVTSNDYQRELFNGDVGVALKNSEGALRVVFARRNEQGRTCYAVLPVELLPGYELSFAMTVHKSQGSEYNQVLLVLPPDGAQRLQNRQLIYTAITRAKELAVCFASRDALSGAIARTLERCSGMA
jgi:exodeoxyribonuclease V alpha subunit